MVHHFAARRAEEHAAVFQIGTEHRNITLAQRYAENGKAAAGTGYKSGTGFLTRECFGEAGFEVYLTTATNYDRQKRQKRYIGLERKHWFGINEY
jgi:hypothetical protein